MLQFFLDFEVYLVYKLSICVIDFLMGVYVEVFVDIIVDDINDNFFVFVQQFYVVILFEVFVIGMFVV